QAARFARYLRSHWPRKRITMRAPRFRSLVGLTCAAVCVAAAARADDAAVRKLLDKAEIEALVVRYVTALDTLDADAYPGVFTEDAEFDVSGTGYKGRAAIRKIVTDSQASRARNEAAGTPSPKLYHVMSNTSIEVIDEAN